MASIDTRSKDGRAYVGDHKVRKGAKIRNRYNQAPHLTQGYQWESDNFTN